jgi:uncharacterized protein (TIRG00374 family)
MTARWSRLAGAALGLAVGAILLALAFRGTPPASVVGLLAAGHWLAAGPATLGATALFVLAKTARWRRLLGAPASAPWGVLLPAVLAGLALNALVPHAGELVRAVSLERRARLPAARVLASIVAERVFDLCGVLILAALALARIPVTPALAAAVRLLALVAFALAAAIVLALAAPAFVTRLVARAARALPPRARPWVARQLAAALDGLAPVRSPATALVVLGWSLAQWLAVALVVHGSADVVGLPLGFAASCLVVLGIVVAFLLPNAPGYAGSVQVAFVAALAPVGVGAERALAASVVYQLLMVLPLVVGGLACLRATLSRSSSP